MVEQNFLNKYGLAIFFSIFQRYFRFNEDVALKG